MNRLRVNWLKLKQHFCRHAFRVSQMGKRNGKETLIWPCSKCSKQFIFDYGLQAMDKGNVIWDFPWRNEYYDNAGKKYIREETN